MATLPLTPRKLSTLPTVQANLTVLDFVAQQGLIAHQVRPPSLSPMGHTQDRLLSDAATHLRDRARSTSPSPLPATPPSPSVSRRQRDLTTSPMLQQRYPPTPSALGACGQEQQQDGDDGNVCSARADDDSLPKKPKEYHAVRKTRYLSEIPSTEYDGLCNTNNRVRKLKASDSKHKAKPTLAEAEAEAEITERLDLRRSRRRSKALMVQDRSRPVSARLRDEAKKRHNSKNSKTQQNKENLVDVNMTTGAVKSATRESKKLKNAVLAMEAYKPVARLAPGRLTTGDHLVKQGLFSKGTASAPVRIKSKRGDKCNRTFCEAKFLQSKQHTSDTDDVNSATETGNDTGGRKLRPRRRPSSASSPASRCESAPRKRSSSQLQYDSDEQEQEEDSPVTSNLSSSSLLAQRRNNRDKGLQKTSQRASAHYGRRRKRTLLPNPPHARLMTSPQDTAEERTQRSGRRDAVRTEASDKDDVPESSKQRGSKERRNDREERHGIDTYVKRPGMSIMRPLTPPLHEQNKAAVNEAQLSHAPTIEAEARNKASKSRRKLSEKDVIKKITSRLPEPSEDDDNSDNSIYLNVRVSTAHSRRRKLIGQAVDEEALEEVLRRIDAPEQTDSRVIERTTGPSKEMLQFEDDRAHTHHSTGEIQRQYSEVSAWKGSAWTCKAVKSPERQSASTPNVPQVRKPSETKSASCSSEKQRALKGDLHRTAAEIQAVEGNEPLSMFSSALDAADLANGWRLQHTLPHEEHATIASAAKEHKTDALADYNLEQAVASHQPGVEQPDDQSRANFWGVRPGEVVLLSSDPPGAPCEISVPSSSSPRRCLDLSSQGLRPLHLDDPSLSGRGVEGLLDDRSTEINARLLSHDGLPVAMDACRPLDAIEGKPEHPLSEAQVDDCGTGDLRPEMSGAASTIYIGRSVWQNIKAKLAPAAPDAGSQSFSSDVRGTEARPDACSDVVGWEAPKAGTPYRSRRSRRCSGDDDVDATNFEGREPIKSDRPASAQPSLPVSHSAAGGSDLDALALHKDGLSDGLDEQDLSSGPITEIACESAWSYVSGAALHPIPPDGEAERASFQPQLTMVNLFPDPQHRQRRQLQDNVPRPPAATHNSKFSAAAATFPQQRQGFGPRSTTRVQQLQSQLPMGRTNSISSYSNSSFDDLDFLSVRPNPAMRRTQERQNIGSDLPWTLRQGGSPRGVERAGGDRERRYVSEQAGELRCVSESRGSTASGRRGGPTNFWSRQQADQTQLDLSSLLNPRSQSQREMRARATPTTAIADLRERNSTSASQAASSSLDPLDMDWTG